MQANEQDLLLAKLAIHYKVLTKERAGDALKLQRESGTGLDLGTFLVAEGYLRADVLKKLLAARDAYQRRKSEEPSTPAAPTVPAVPATAQEPSPAPATAAPADVPALDLAGNAYFKEQAVEPESEEAPGSSDTVSVPVVAAEATDPGTERPLSYRPGVELTDLLREVQALGASDLHIHGGSPLKVRLHGTLVDTSPTLDGAETERLIYGLLNDDDRVRLEADQQVDFAFSLGDVGRFRANAYRQQRGLDAVFRAIPPDPPTLEDLGLPAALAQMVEHHQGLVLLTGPAGCGKSSTMAALINVINESRPDHIITVEDPIEYVHRSKRCLVNQRQVGPHTESFARALRAALREDPDVISIGEMRDLETISLALTAAETGHLVIGTLHTSSAIRTINRLLGVFPPEQQAQIRTMVSESLRAIVSQRLVRRADGEGRVPALEILINTQAAGNLIRENKTFQIQSVMQTGSTRGMCLLDASLGKLVEAGTITRQEARLQAEDPRRFK